jgi:hypothetical protein
VNTREIMEYIGSRLQYPSEIYLKVDEKIYKLDDVDAGEKDSLTLIAGPEFEE